MLRIEWDGEPILGPHQTPEEVVPNKYYMGGITGAMIQNATPAGAFVQAMEAEMAAVMGDMRRQLNRDFYAMGQVQGMQNQANLGNYANLLGNAITGTNTLNGNHYVWTDHATFTTGGLIAADGFDHYPTAKLPTAWERLGRAARRLPLPRRLRRLMGLPCRPGTA